jgi:hypothetical protein
MADLAVGPDVVHKSLRLSARLLLHLADLTPGRSARFLDPPAAPADTLSASQFETASKFPTFWIVPTTANPLSVHGEQMPPAASRRPRRSVAKNSPPMLFAHFVGDAGRKRIEANVIADPAWTLDGRAFFTAIRAARAGTQPVARCARSCVEPASPGPRRSAAPSPKTAGATPGASATAGTDAAANAFRRQAGRLK